MSYPEKGASHTHRPKFVDDAISQEGKRKDFGNKHQSSEVTTRFPNSHPSEDKRAEDFVSVNKGD